MAWRFSPSNISTKQKKKKKMGQYGVHSGYQKVQNWQAGTATVVLNGSGDATTEITFKRKFKNTPVVIAGFQTDDDTATVNVYSKSNSGCTIHVDGAAMTSANATVGYIAADDPSTGFS